MQLTLAGMAGATGYDACLASYSSGGSIAQYQDGVADWDDTVGTSHFAACLRATANAAARWTVSATCPTDDGTFWNAIPPAASQISSTSTGETAATASMRFGLRLNASQTPGSYLAPITFTVTAP